MKQTVRKRSRMVLAVAALTAIGLTVSACGGSGSTGNASSKASASAQGKQGQKTPVPLEPAGAFYDGFEQVADNGWRPTINDTAAQQRGQTSLAAMETQPKSLIRQVSSPRPPAREGSHALQMTVPHQLGSFRSEVSAARCR